MIKPDSVNAELLERHASEISDAAARELLEKHPAMSRRFGERAFKIWTGHLNQRLLELAAALAAGKASLFIARVNWSRAAMLARDIEADELYTSLQALRTAVRPYLREGGQQAVDECFAAALQTLKASNEEFEATSLDPGLLSGRVAMRYIQAVIAGNALPGMAIVLDAIDDGLDPRDAILKVLLPAQREVGRLWHMNEISVAEEHMVTVTTQRLMAVIASRVRRAPENGKTAIATTVAGNIHEIGIRAIAYMLEFEGWRTVYLGPDVPRDDLPAAIECFDADVILLSLALSSQMAELQRTIERIRASSDSVKIIVGGNGFGGAPDIWREMGADGFGNSAESAIAMAEELASQVPESGAL